MRVNKKMLRFIEYLIKQSPWKHALFLNIPKLTLLNADILILIYKIANYFL
jgi:hypothetical protein